MTFKEYYQHYLSLHQNKTCRRLHVLGQVMTLAFLFTVIYNGGWWLLLLPITPFIVYPFAWTGHFYFEKNKPAAFKNPVWAKVSDWVMLFDILRGKISF
jgi:hypothetical protein